VERAAADEVFRPVLFQLDAPALHQRQQVGLPLDLVNVGFRNAPGHSRQQKILEVVEALVAQHANGNA
jgi:hypothetical protein